MLPYSDLPFTLDRLMTYANSLFSPKQVKITIENQKLSKNQALRAGITRTLGDQTGSFVGQDILNSG